jgi:PAS domain S-box-containing protein
MQGKVIGTFAMYYREPRSPSLRDQEIIEQITHLAGVAIERKLIQEALRRSEAYLAEAQRLAKTGSWAYNPFTGKTVYWSDEMFRIFGLDPREDPNSENFWQLVHPEDRDRVRARVEREAHEKKEYVDEYRMVLPDGTIKHILDIGHPVFDDAGDVVEFVGTTVDVTERKRAEEELRRSESFLAQGQRISHTGSWGWQVATGAIYWSKEHFRIFEFNPETDKPSYSLFMERIHPEDRASFEELLNRAVRDKSDFENQGRIVLPDGSIKFLRTVGQAFVNPPGELEFIGTVMDVTDLKRAEEMQIAIAREREMFAQQRATQFARANEALRGCLDTLASVPELDEFLGQVTAAITKSQWARLW